MYIGVCLHACLCEGVGFPKSGVTHSCELLCGCWQLNAGSLQDQSFFLSTEPFICLGCLIPDNSIKLNFKIYFK